MTTPPPRPSTSPLLKRLTNVIRLALVLALSLGLLIFVGLGEARRTYPRFEIEKLAAQGELVQIAMQPFLLADLPLNQFPGFSTLTQPILASDPSIAAIYITNVLGNVVFSNSSTGELGDLGDLTTPSSIQPDVSRYSVTENEQYYQATFSLRNRFDEVGQLHILLPKSVVENTITQGFLTPQGVAIIAICLYMIFLFLTSSRWMGEEESGWQRGGVRLLSVSYGVAFIAVALLVILTLTNIYQNGIRGKIRALAGTLEYRLNTAFELGLTLDDFTGLDSVLNEYQQLNPDLGFVALSSNDSILLHTDPGQIGRQWVAPGGYFEEETSVQQPGSTNRQELSLHLGIAKSVVYNRLWTSARNFLALFVASAFLANLFFSFIRSQANRPKFEPGTLHTKRGFLLSLIGPMYFVSIFVVHGLTTAFLPRYFNSLAVEGNIGINTSTLFTTYYISYTLALFLTAKPADKHGPKPFLVVGAMLIAIELLLLTVVRNFYAMYLVQAITGFGEGMLFNAVFTYIITVATKQQRTRGAAIIVTSLYGGWLSGTAIGALLAADPAFGLRGVFLLGAVIAGVVLLYTFFAIPSFKGENFGERDVVVADRDPGTMTMGSLTKEYMRQEVAREVERRRIAESGSLWEKFNYFILKRVGDLDFLKASLLVGVPVKIIVAGLFKASLPLVLANLNYPTEDVGQIMMLYFAGVLVSSSIVSRWADKTGNIRWLLFIGGFGNGLGLLLMGLIGWNMVSQLGFAALSTVLLIVGMVVLGLAHGFIQAPIVTYISNTHTAKQYGQGQASSLYRLYERFGNIGGPLLIGGILVATDYQAIAIAYIGVVISVFGMLFLIGRQPSIPKA